MFVPPRACGGVAIFIPLTVNFEVFHLPFDGGGPREQATTYGRFSKTVKLENKLRVRLCIHKHAHSMGLLETDRGAFVLE